MESKHLETIAIHAGMKESRTAGENGPVVPPIQMSTIYEHRKGSSKDEDLIYTRHANPNRIQLENQLSELEGGVSAAAFASGMAAITAVFQALHPGSHILLPMDLYHGTRSLIKEYSSRWSLDFDFVDTTNLAQVESFMKEETRLIWIETPSNPMLNISSVRKISEIAHKNEVLVAVDNTWPTPYNMRPLELGADLVMHSTTKYLGGHSDILGGAVITKNDKGLFSRIREIQCKQGSVPSPHDCWLLSRSIRSFPYRMRAHNENASKIASFMEGHKKVERVYYPGLPSHEGHDIAAEEMNGFGGMISFLYLGNASKTKKVAGSSQLITEATSLGGIESTWEHRRSSEGDDSKTPENLIRLSVGLEHPEDLIADLERALSV